MNTLLSLGRDSAWRRKAAEYLPEGRVLDLGGGTGAEVLALGDRQVVLVDPVFEMLDLAPNVAKVAAVGEALPSF